MDPDILEPHPAALDYAGLHEIELDALAANIELYGQLQPIHVTRDQPPLVVDGWHRTLACRRLRRPVLAVEVEADVDPWETAAGLNERRRQLDRLQRAMAAARSVTRRHGGAHDASAVTRAEAAATAGVTLRELDAARRAMAIDGLGWEIIDASRTWRRTAGITPMTVWQAERFASGWSEWALERHPDDWDLSAHRPWIQISYGHAVRAEHVSEVRAEAVRILARAAENVERALSARSAAPPTTDEELLAHAGEDPMRLVENVRRDVWAAAAPAWAAHRREAAAAAAADWDDAAAAEDRARYAEPGEPEPPAAAPSTPVTGPRSAPDIDMGSLEPTGPLWIGTDLLTPGQLALRTTDPVDVLGHDQAGLVDAWLAAGHADGVVRVHGWQPNAETIREVRDAGIELHSYASAPHDVRAPSDSASAVYVLIDARQDDDVDGGCPWATVPAIAEWPRLLRADGTLIVQLDGEVLWTPPDADSGGDCVSRVLDELRRAGMLLRWVRPMSDDALALAWQWPAAVR